jgi:hypothetical protein
MANLCRNIIVLPDIYRGIPAHLIINLFKNDEKKCDILGSGSPFMVAILVLLVAGVDSNQGVRVMSPITVALETRSVSTQLASGFGSAWNVSPDDVRGQ